MNKKSKDGPTRKHFSSRLRPARGNMIIFAAVMVLAVLGLILYFTMDLGRIFGTSQEHKTATETAALAAATQLSSIVIPDTNFGWISLSDYPPLGEATIAGDGEPLPVTGINTVTATARLDWIMAKELNNPTMITLAGLDVDHAKQASENLNKVLKGSLTPGGHPLARNLNGEAVKPYDDAKRTYETQIVRLSNGGKSVEGSFKMTLGWLEGGSTTNTYVPRPESMALISGDQKVRNKYKAFINIPAHGKDFYFVGVDKEPSLVDTKRFHADDGSRPSSIVKVEADHEIITTSGEGGEKSKKVIHSISCAQPFAQKDTAPPGTLTLGFPSGPVEGIDRPLDMAIDPDLAANPTSLLSPKGGDWPVDSQGQTGILSPVTIPGISDSTPTAAQIYAAGLFHWIRTGREDLDLEALKKLQEKAFAEMGNPGESKIIGFNPFSLPAYADTDKSGDLRLVGIFSGDVGGGDDPRSSLIDPNKPPTAEDIAAFEAISNYKDLDDTLPANVLVVGLDEEGNIYSADGKNKLTINDIYSFWSSLKAMNAAGLATMAMAKKLKEQLSTSTTNQSQINSLNQQIQQKQNQLQTDTTLSGTEYYALQEEINQLQQQVAQLMNTPSTSTAVPASVENAFKNGQKAAMISSQIAAQQKMLTSKGLAPDGKNFTLAGQKLTIHPMAPVSLDAILNGQASSGPSDWTSSNFPIYEMPSGGSVSAAPITPPGWAWTLQPARAASSIPAGQGRTYMFEFTADGKVQTTILPANPFIDSSVSEDQWFALSLDAKTTGESTLPVSWVFAARDQTVNRGVSERKGNKHGGQPIPGTEEKWCTMEKYGKGRKRRGSGRGSRGGAFLPPDPMQPAFARSGGGSKGKGKSRKSYYCGGQSCDMQLRAPTVGNGGLTKGQSPSVSPIGNVQGKPGSGPATVNVAGINAIIPDTMNWAVTSGAAAVSPPGSVIAPGTSEPIKLCPPPPRTLL